MTRPAFITEKGKNYYILDPSGRRSKIGAVLTFKGNYPKSEKPPSYRADTLLFSDGKRSRQLTFEYGGKSYTIEVEYNPNKVDFYSVAPQTEFGLYFDADVEFHAKKRLLGGLSPLLKGRNELDAVNFLLRFVQRAFAYRTNSNLNGKNPSFPKRRCTIRDTSQRQSS